MNAQPGTAVLFVCMGNICRSPAAEGVFRSILQSRGLAQRVWVESAGTIDSGGAAPDPRMRDAALHRGIDLCGRARQVVRADLETFDLVIAMDRDNLAYLRSLHSAPRAIVKLFSEFLDTETWPVDVPDPYLLQREGFDCVLDMIAAACPTICAFVKTQFLARSTP